MTDAIFRFDNPMGPVVGFRPKSDDLGHRILKSDFTPSDFAEPACISRPILFSDRKIKTGSSESDRIIISLTTLPSAGIPEYGGMSALSLQDYTGPALYCSNKPGYCLGLDSEWVLCSTQTSV